MIGVRSASQICHDGEPHTRESPLQLCIKFSKEVLAGGLRHGSQQRELGLGETTRRQMHGFSVSYLLTEASVSPHRQDDAVMSGAD